ncbi:hypothetical protein [Spongiactinospora sp. TRM90649]|uniref:hypothetical protein n=1 Tax=Spongiactinospora sp. TRM90649 TaxID=3031114 RepID=UPI0023F91F45|nr:hypothetical protein [Spongiactinospora sp. TRM90649]MDF5754571.1 hypothetical protein [Spongiactinospora sp. TRM90649]
MAEFDLPADLIAAQRAYLAAERTCEEIASAIPAATEVASGKATIPEAQRTALTEARAERARHLDILYGHPWWATIDRADHLRARTHLRQAAETP